MSDENTSFQENTVESTTKIQSDTKMVSKAVKTQPESRELLVVRENLADYKNEMTRPVLSRQDIVASASRINTIALLIANSSDPITLIAEFTNWARNNVEKKNSIYTGIASSPMLYRGLDEYPMKIADRSIVIVKMVESLASKKKPNLSRDRFAAAFDSKNSDAILAWYEDYRI